MVVVDVDVLGKVVLVVAWIGIAGSASTFMPLSTRKKVRRWAKACSADLDSRLFACKAAQCVSVHSVKRVYTCRP